MQYVLSEKELMALAPRVELDASERSAMTLSIMVAKLTKHPCPADRSGKRASGYGYCNDCQAYECCPYKFKDLAQ